MSAGDDYAIYGTQMAEIAGLRMPVWGAFLLIYPPLCLALFAVTYLAFRWRWWRASNSQ